MFYSRVVAVLAAAALTGSDAARVRPVSYADLGAGTCATVNGTQPRSEKVDLFIPRFAGSGWRECQWHCSQKPACHGYVYSSDPERRVCRHILHGPLKLKRIKKAGYNGRCMVKSRYVHVKSLVLPVAARRVPRQVQPTEQESILAGQPVDREMDEAPAPVTAVDVQSYNDAEEPAEDDIEWQDRRSAKGKPSHEDEDDIEWQEFQSAEPSNTQDLALPTQQKSSSWSIRRSIAGILISVPVVAAMFL